MKVRDLFKVNKSYIVEYKVGKHFWLFLEALDENCCMINANNFNEDLIANCLAEIHYNFNYEQEEDTFVGNINMDDILNADISDVSTEAMDFIYFECRTCSECGKLMKEGYCIDDGTEYYCSDECLHKNYTEEEWEEMYDDGEGDSYWTEWEE